MAVAEIGELSAERYGFFVRIFFARNRVESSHNFCYRDDLDKMVPVKNC